VIIETIDHSAKLNAEFWEAGARYGRAITLILGTGEDHVVSDVALDPPNVAGSLGWASKMYMA